MSVEADLLRLLAGEILGPLTLCELPPRFVMALSAKTEAILLSSETALKQSKHRAVGVFDYLALPRIFDLGQARRHGEFGLLFFMHTRVSPDRFTKAAVKVTRDRKELYLTTLHIIAPSDLKANIRRTTEF